MSGEGVVFATPPHISRDSAGPEGMGVLVANALGLLGLGPNPRNHIDRCRTSDRVLELPCSIIWKRSRDTISSINSDLMLYARHRGVLHAQVEKSIRIKRMASLANCSR